MKDKLYLKFADSHIKLHLSRPIPFRLVRKNVFGKSLSAKNAMINVQGKQDEQPQEHHGKNKEFRS
jgi:hypothetical protein